MLSARKTERLRQMGDNRHQTQHEMDHESLLKLPENSLVRLLRILFTTPTLLFLSVDVSIVYGYLYLVFTTLTYIYSGVYGLSSDISALAFLGIGIRMFTGE